MTDAPADLTGQTLGDFRVLRKIGQGGMGQVYLARQLSLKRDVALKLLRTEMAADETALKRFQAEAEAVARISHPNIVQVYALGEHQGQRYMALEYVQGSNLRSFLEKKGPPELPVALAIMRQIAAALQRASELGIVHRDIKPENILLTRKAEVKVTDFGLSRLTNADQQPLHLTRSGATVGTPLYMAPEQVHGKPTDHRTDIYALGITCYHLLAGEPPFRGTTAFEVAMKHVQEQAASLAFLRPDLPADLVSMVHRMMEKEPAARYQTAKEILRDLGRVREGLSLNLPSPSLFSGPVPSGPTTVLAVPGRSPWPARLLGVLAILGVGGLGWFAYALAFPPAKPTPAFVGPGLPDIRSANRERVLSGRERELLALTNSRSAKPEQVAEAWLDLGLLYVKERRHDEADAAFKKLASDHAGTGPKLRAGLTLYAAAAVFGEAIVLAYRDQEAESVTKFEAAVRNFPPRAGGDVVLRSFLLNRLPLTEAIVAALHRNAENLKPKKLPPSLDVLKSPDRPR